MQEMVAYEGFFFRSAVRAKNYRSSQARVKRESTRSMSWQLATVGAFEAFGRARLQKRARSLATRRRKQRYANVPTYLSTYLPSQSPNWFLRDVGGDARRPSAATFRCPGNPQIWRHSTPPSVWLHCPPSRRNLSLSLTTRTAKLFSCFHPVRGSIVYSSTTALHLFLGYQFPGPTVDSFALQATGYLTLPSKNRAKLFITAPRALFSKGWRRVALKDAFSPVEILIKHSVLFRF